MFRLTRRRRGKERDCQQDADNGDDPASSSSATRNFPPADSADPCSPARVSRRVTTPFFELLEREEGLSLESLFLSRLFRGRAPSFPRSIITFFPFLLARRSKTTIEEDVVSSVPPTNEREESSNAVLGRARLVSIAFSSGLMRSLEEIKG